MPDASVYTACWVDNFLLAAKTEAHLRVLEKIFLEVAEEVSMKVKKEDQVDNQHTGKTITVEALRNKTLTQ